MATEIRMPQFGVSMETGTIAQWLKKVGDEVKAGDVLASIETEKLTNDVVSEVDGVVLAIVAQEGEDVPVQGLMAVVGAAGEVWSGALAEAAPTVQEEPVQEVFAAPAVQNISAGGRIKVSPLAKKMAAAMNVDLTQLSGTGTSGRIKAKDVRAFAEKATVAPAKKETVAASPAGPASAFPTKDLALMDGDTVESLSGMRKVVAQRMFQSCAEIPPVTQTMKVDVTALMAFRKQLNEGREKKFTVNDFILKAVAKALRRNPTVLVSLDGDKLIRRAHVNLGMAVALDEGLIVPVIHDADKMGLEELASVAKDYAARAKSNQLTTEEYKGSTFTISNLGMFGIESFTPIINQPDAAILGVNAIEDELMLAEDGTVCVRKVMRISLTFDHRLLDGASAAVFQMCIRDLLQSPMDIVL